MLEFSQGDLPQALLVKVREENVDLVLLKGLEGGGDNFVELDDIQDIVLVHVGPLKHLLSGQLPRGYGQLELVQDVIKVDLLEGDGELFEGHGVALIDVHSLEVLDYLGL